MGVLNRGGSTVYVITVLNVLTECSVGFYGENCAQECGAGCGGDCDHVTGCECKDWWVKEGTCGIEVTGEDTVNLITLVQHPDKSCGGVSIRNSWVTYYFGAVAVTLTVCSLFTVILRCMEDTKRFTSSK